MIYIALLYCIQILERTKNTKHCDDLRTIYVSKYLYCIRLCDSKYLTSIMPSDETTKST
jgi:hypothetical protein